MEPKDTTVVRPPYCFHCQTAYQSQRTIGWELQCTCIVMYHNVWFAESSRALALWCITTFDLFRTLVHLHCDVSQRLICWELSWTYIVMYHNVWFCWDLSYTFIVTSWSECQQLKHGDLDDVSRAIRHDYGRKSAPNHHVDVTKSMSVWKGRFKDSRHDYFMMLQLSSSGYSCL